MGTCCLTEAQSQRFCCFYDAHEIPSEFRRKSLITDTAKTMQFTVVAVLSKVAFSDCDST